MKVLWLASWYPDEYEPTNGDFVQRHAKAVSLFMLVDVIHVAQKGKDCGFLDKMVTNVDDNLKEIIHYFPFKETSISIVDKFRYNSLYLRYYKSVLKKYIIENGKPDIVHVQTAMKAGMLAVWLKKNFNIPYVITDQWTIYNSNAPDAYEKRDLLFKRFTKQIFANASLFISVSKNLVETIAKKIISVPCKIAYNVVNINHFFHKDEKRSSNFTFVHASTFKEQKNPQAIIDAFISFNKEFPTTRLLMIGSVPEEIHLYYSEKKLPEGLINFMGFVPYKKLGSFVQQCDAFVLFSRRENMPCVVLEALCCGLPVITSNAGGVAEVITEKNGVVVYDYNTESLAEAMKNMYLNYQQYNKEEISAKAINMFSYEVIGKQIADMYKDVLKHH